MTVGVETGVSASPTHKRLRLSLKATKEAREKTAASQKLAPLFSSCDSPKTALQAPEAVGEAEKTTVKTEPTEEKYHHRRAPHVASLENLGNTCFLNSVLQSLRYTEGFVDKINSLAKEISLTERYKSALPYNNESKARESPLQWRLVKSVQKLFARMESREASLKEGSIEDPSVKPTNVMRIISELNPMFEGNLQHDAHELLRCLLCYIQDATNEVNCFRKEVKPPTTEIKQETCPTSCTLKGGHAQKRGLGSPRQLLSNQKEAAFMCQRSTTIQNLSFRDLVQSPALREILSSPKKKSHGTCMGACGGNSVSESPSRRALDLLPGAATPNGLVQSLPPCDARTPKKQLVSSIETQMKFSPKLKVYCAEDVLNHVAGNDDAASLPSRYQAALTTPKKEATGESDKVDTGEHGSVSNKRLSPSPRSKKLTVEDVVQDVMTDGDKPKRKRQRKSAGKLESAQNVSLEAPNQVKVTLSKRGRGRPPKTPVVAQHGTVTAEARAKMSCQLQSSQSALGTTKATNNTQDQKQKKTCGRDQPDNQPSILSMFNRSSYKQKRLGVRGGVVHIGRDDGRFDADILRMAEQKKNGTHITVEPDAKENASLKESTELDNQNSSIKNDTQLRDTVKHEEQTAKVKGSETPPNNYRIGPRVLSDASRRRIPLRRSLGTSRRSLRLGVMPGKIKLETDNCASECSEKPAASTSQTVPDETEPVSGASLSPQKSGYSSPRRLINGRPLTDEELRSEAMDQSRQACVRLQKCDSDNSKYYSIFTKSTRKESVPQQPIKRDAIPDFVEELFQGGMLLRTRCLECEGHTERAEDYQDISVPVKKRKTPIAPADGTTHEDEVLLSDSDDDDPNNWITSAFSEVERLGADNKYFCDKCMRLVEAERSVHYDTIPLVLTLHLKRFAATVGLFGGVSKINDHVTTPMVLSCMQKNCDPDCDDPKHRYELFAVVTHTGISISSGHYICYVKTTGKFPDLARPATPPIKTEAAAAELHKKEAALPCEAMMADDNNNADPNNNLGLDQNQNFEYDHKTPDTEAEMQTSLVGSGDSEVPQVAWLECDDDLVSVLTEEEFEKVLSPEGAGSPYLLFYQRLVV